MAVIHAGVTAAFWLLWLFVVYQGSHIIAMYWPQSGNILGIAGTLLLFMPTASLLAWDVMTRVLPQPRDGDARALPPNYGYDTFSWRKVAVHAAGITLIGLGFGVSYLSDGP
jgi:hypothetical protein